MNLPAVPSPSALSRKYSARATKRVHDDRSNFVNSIQNSSFSYEASPNSPKDANRESANRVILQIPQRQAPESRRPSFLHYKTEILSGTTKLTTASLLKEDGNSERGSRLDGDVGPTTQLMLEVERAVKFETLSGNRSRRSSSSSLTEAAEEVLEEHEDDILPRRSARLDRKGTATDVVRLSNAAPEKIPRITIDSVVNTMQYQEKEKKKIGSRTKSTDVLSPATENPAATFVRPLEEILEEAVATWSKSEQIIAKGSKKKVWLTQGLCVRQDTDPRHEKVFGKRLNSHPPQRSLLLTPLFAEARLLKLDRNFKLPYDVFNALPRGQPKPEYWKKLHKSKSDLILSILKRFR